VQCALNWAITDSTGPFSDEGLQKDGTEMSQIPTYVTAVPNGTEKVLKFNLFHYHAAHSIAVLTIH